MKLKSKIAPVFLFLVFGVAGAEVPGLISFQGVLGDSTGPLTGEHTIQFSIYDVEQGGSPLWTEVQQVVLGTDGVFSVNLGSVTPLNLPFDRPYFVGISVDNGDELEPRIPMTSSPYALSGGGTSGVSSINGLQGDVNIVGGNNISVNIDTTSGTITVVGPSLQAGEGISIQQARTTMRRATKDGEPVRSKEAGTYTISIADNGVTADKIQPDIISSINNIHNDAGNIEIAGAGGINVQNDSLNSRIIISGAGSPSGIQTINGVTPDNNGNLTLIEGDHIYIDSMPDSNAIEITAYYDTVNFYADTMFSEANYSTYFYSDSAYFDTIRANLCHIDTLYGIIIYSDTVYSEFGSFGRLLSDTMETNYLRAPISHIESIDSLSFVGSDTISIFNPDISNDTLVISMMDNTVVMNIKRLTFPDNSLLTSRYPFLEIENSIDSGTAVKFYSNNSFLSIYNRPMLEIAPDANGIEFYYFSDEQPFTFMEVNHLNGELTFYWQGQRLTTFGGESKRVAIQKVNNMATPTLGDNNFSITGIPPINVTTSDHGIEISCEDCGGGGGGCGDTCSCSNITTGGGGNDGRIYVRSAANDTVMKFGVEGDDAWMALVRNHSSYFYTDFDGTYSYPLFAVSGDLYATGDLSVNGAKNFLVRHPEKSDSFIRFSSTESPEVMLEYRGVVELIDGYGEAELPHTFVLMSEPETYSVNVTPQTLDPPDRIGAIVEDGRVKIRAYGGDGSMKVAFIVYSTRRGYRDYDVVIPEPKAVKFSERVGKMR